MRKLAAVLMFFALLALPAFAAGPLECRYTFSDWGACVNGVQTRHLIGLDPNGPPNCVGVAFISRPCTSCTPPQEPDAQGQCRTPLALMTCEIRIQYAQGDPQHATIVSAGADYCDAKGIERALIKSLSDVAE